MNGNRHTQCVRATGMVHSVDPATLHCWPVVTAAKRSLLVPIRLQGHNNKNNNAAAHCCTKRIHELPQLPSPTTKLAIVDQTSQRPFHGLMMPLPTLHMHRAQCTATAAPGTGS